MLIVSHYCEKRPGTRSYVTARDVVFFFPRLITFFLFLVPERAQTVGKYQKCCQNGEERAARHCLQPALWEQSEWCCCFVVLFFSFVSVLFFVVVVGCFFLFFDDFCCPMCRGSKAQNQRKNSQSRSKQSKLRRSPKRSRQRWWMRYLLGDDDDDDDADCLLRLACTPVLTRGPCVALSQGPPKYTKAILKKGDKTNFPKKGDTVSCWYTGSLEDGTVFDTNVVTGRPPTSF